MFTYHHKESAAWNAVLESLLKSGFCVTAIYPIPSEPEQSIHIRSANSISNDAILVCRKKVGDKSIDWDSFQDELYFKTKETLERMQRAHTTLSYADLYVVVFGKCLEVYSKYYPKVLKSGKTVSASEAINGVLSIIDQIMME